MTFPPSSSILSTNLIVLSTICFAKYCLTNIPSTSCLYCSLSSLPCSVWASKYSCQRRSYSTRCDSVKSYVFVIIFLSTISVISVSNRRIYKCFIFSLSSSRFDAPLIVVTSLPVFNRNVFASQYLLMK